MTAYKVCVAIPVYNVAAYVERALLSALNQTMPDIEYLLIDDRGTDNSMDIVRRIIAEHPRGKDVRIIEQAENKGVAVGRDTAVAMATAPYIYFMDSDDEIPVDAVALLYEAIKSKPGVEVAVGKYALVESGMRPFELERDCGSGFKELKNEQVPMAYATSSPMFPVMVWNKLYDLAFLRREGIHCFAGCRVHEDVYYSMLVAFKAKHVIYIPLVTYFYYANGGSLMDALRRGRYGLTHHANRLSLSRNMLSFCKTLKGRKKNILEANILKRIYGDTRSLVVTSDLSKKEKKQALGEIKRTFESHKFTLAGMSCKAKVFWAVGKMPTVWQMRFICLVEKLKGRGF